MPIIPFAVALETICEAYPREPSDISRWQKRFPPWTAVGWLPEIRFCNWLFPDRENYCRSLLLLVVSLFSFFSVANPARAEFVLTFAQSGSNVVATGSGTLNLTALSYLATGNVAAHVIGNMGIAVAGPTTSTLTDEYQGAVLPLMAIGTGTLVNATSGSGNIVGIKGQASQVFVPNGYVSGSSLSDTSTWTNSTFTTLGLTPGTYTWTWGSGASADSFVVQIAVPEPSSLILLGLGSGIIGIGVLWNRRRAARPALAAG